MSYRQKAGPRDIRSLHINTQTKALEQSLPVHTSKAHEKMATHHTGREIKQIAVIVVPLLALLVFSYYMDITRHWVVPLGERLFNLGA